MAMSKDRMQREASKFKETALGETAVNIIDAMDAEVILFDADDSAPDYIGLNEDKDAVTTDTDWIVLKFTYSGSNVTKIERAVGAWDSRAGLF